MIVCCFVPIGTQLKCNQTKMSKFVAKLNKEKIMLTWELKKHWKLSSAETTIKQFQKVIYLWKINSEKNNNHKIWKYIGLLA